LRGVAPQRVGEPGVGNLNPLDRAQYECPVP
jgi:hypothetical protein